MKSIINKIMDNSKNKVRGNLNSSKGDNNIINNGDNNTNTIINTVIKSEQHDRVNVYIISDDTNELLNEVKVKFDKYSNNYTLFKLVYKEILSHSFNDNLMNEIDKALFVILIVDEQITSDIQFEFDYLEKIQKEHIFKFYNGDKCSIKDFKKINDIDTILKNTFTKMQNIVVDNTKNIYINEKNADDFHSHSLLKKSGLEAFDCCNGNLFDIILNKEISSGFDTGNKYIGIKLLKWIINEGDFLDNNDLVQFFSVHNINENNYLYYSCLGMVEFQKFNFNKALEYYNKALNIAKKSKCDDWIISDILINCRNAEHSCNIDNFLYENHSQKELDNREVSYFMPMLDKFTAISYESIIKDEIFWEGKNQNSHAFNNDFNTAVKYIESRVFFSLLIGSYTQLVETKRLLSNILYRYSKIHNNNKFLYYSIKSSLFFEEHTKIEKLLQLHFENIKRYIAPESDEIWEKIHSKFSETDKTRCFVIFGYLCNYFSDENFCIYEKQIYSLIKKSKLYYYDNNYIKLLKKIGVRISSDEYIELIMWFIENEKLLSNFNEWFFVLSQNGSYKDISTITKNRFIDCLDQNLQFLLKNDNNPQFISILINLFGKEFYFLYEKYNLLTVNQGIDIKSIDVSLLKANLRKTTILQAMKNCLDIARSNYDANTSDKGFTVFRNTPLVDMKNFISDEMTDDIVEFISSDVLSYCKFILTNEKSLYYKNECLDLLFRIVTVNNKFELDFLEEIKLYNDEYNCPLFFENYSIETLKIKLVMLKYIVLSNNEDELVRELVNYNSQNTEVKLTIVESITEYLKYISSYKIEINVFLGLIYISILKQSDVQVTNIQGILYLYNYSFFNQFSKDLIENIIIEGKDMQKYKLLRALVEFDIVNRAFAESISNMLLNDSAYFIRANARTVLNK